MANVDAPFGARPVRHRNGTAWNIETHRVVTAYGTSLFTGDAVQFDTNGFIVRAVPGDAKIYGIFRGCRYRDATGAIVVKPYWPASTATLGSSDVMAFVLPVSDVIFEIQHDSDSATPALTDIGGSADIVFTHAGDTLTGQSKMELNTDTVAATAANFRILRFVDDPKNEVGNFARVEGFFVEDAARTAAGI